MADDGLLLYAVFTLNVLAYTRWVVTAISEITAALNIKCFTIKQTEAKKSS